MFYVLGDDENDQRVIKMIEDILPELETKSEEETENRQK
jgi:hypothetical protein